MKGIKILGNHTALGFIKERNAWKKIPYLNNNYGKIPPFLIAVGSRNRVLKAERILSLKDYVLIDEIAKEKIGEDAYGRVSIGIGKYKDIPIVIFETQMGCPATQIIVKEVLSFASMSYKKEKGKIRTDGIYLIRAGTSGGVNGNKGDEVKIGDIIIARKSYGVIGSVAQSYFGELDFFEKAIYHRKIENTKIGKMIKTEANKKVLELMVKVAEREGFNYHVGNNFTKDSLYSELDEDMYISLRDNLNIYSTEMEQTMIDLIAWEYRREGISVNAALCTGAVGAIPGKSFPETKEEKEKANKSEELVLKLAAETLYLSALGNRKRI